MDKNYLTRARYKAYFEEIKYMEGEGGQLLAKLLASSPGSGMGRPNDLPIHQLAGEFRGYLQDIKSIVKSALIIDDLRRDECNDLVKVTLGCTVIVRYKDDDESEEYTVLGKHEVDISKGRISCWSPIGSALMGKHKGDLVVAKLSSMREVQMIIEDVRRPSLNFDYPYTRWKSQLERVVV